MNSDLLALGRAFLPEACLVGAALMALAVDLTAGKRAALGTRTRTSAVIAAVGILASLYFTLQHGASGAVMGGTLIFDRVAIATRVGILALCQLTIVAGSGTSRSRHPAEFFAVMLFAATGLMVMAVAQQLLIGFLALELASLSLYILAGFDKTRPASAEAALKYFLLGGMSAAFLLFGFSLVYGIAGSIELPVIAHRLATQPGSPLLNVALVMILLAFGFKVAAAPFHLWAPDAYQGAPAESAALIASASKLAGFIFFSRLLWTALPGAAGNPDPAAFAPGWLPVLAIVAAASLLLGNFGALAQTNVRRLLAYSAIAHAGALLLGVAAAHHAGTGPLFYYAATYGIATIGAFGVIAAVDRASRCEQITDLAGLHRRSPLLAGCLFVFVLSLAGIPPLAGFFGKFYVFAAALQLNGLGGVLGWLAVAAILLSAVALYYYLVVLKQALVAGPAPGTGKIVVPLETAFALVLAAALLVVLGLFPSALLQLIG